MIIQDRVKSRSLLTLQEWDKGTEELLHTLKDDEWEALQQFLEGDLDLAATLAAEEYDETPCSIQDFLDDPFYLGESTKGLFKPLREDIEILFSSGHYETVLLTGALGIGKSEFASICILRMLYEASCLKDPAVSYGLTSGSKIGFCMLAPSEQVARAATFEKITAKIQKSEYFMNVFPPQNKGLAEGKGVKGNEIIFPNHLTILCGSSSDNSVLGANIMGGFVDELNFFRKDAKSAPIQSPRYGGFSKAGKIFDGLRRRIKSRFTKRGKLPGLLIGASSKTTKDSLTEQFIREAAANNESTVFVRDYSIVDVKPHAFSGKYFKVVVGNEYYQSRILDSDEEVAKYGDEAVIVEAPEELRQDFTRDLDMSLRDFLGVSTSALHSFMTKVEYLQDMIDDTRSHPFFAPQMADPSQWDSRCPYNMDWNALAFQQDNGEWTPRLNPWAKRFIHLDPALTGDAFGVCFPAQTKVLMADFTEKNIEEIKVGEYVIDAYGDIRKVSRTFERDYDGTLIDISVIGGSKISTTPEHPFLGKKREKICSGKTLIKPLNEKRPFYESRDYDPDWINAGDLSTQDFVCLPKVNFNQVPPGIKATAKIGDFPLNKEFGYICGYYLAEGSFFSKKNNKDRLLPQFTFGWNALDLKHVEILKQCLEYFGITEHYEIKRYNDKRDSGNSGQSSISLRVQSANLGRALFIMCGRYSGEKRLNPNFIWTAPDEFLEGLFTAYMQGDGTVNAIRRKIGNKIKPTASLHAKTKSPYIALLMEILCRRKGVAVSRHLRNQAYKYGVHERKLPIWEIALNSITSINKVLGEGTIENMPEPTRQSSLSFEYDRWMFHKISSVGQRQFQGKVYNLEVEGSNTYTAERIGVHNCMGHIAGLAPVKKSDDQGEITEYLPMYVIDFILRIKGEPGEEVLFRKVRQLIYEFSAHGFHIARITTDRFQSRDFIQTLQGQGYLAEVLSLDETKEPYLTLRRAIYDRRVKCYPYEHLLDELRKLEEGPTKIDHPATPDASKDCADALCGVVFSLCEKATYSEPVLPVKGEFVGDEKEEPHDFPDIPDHDKHEGTEVIKAPEPQVASPYRKKEKVVLKPSYKKVDESGKETDLTQKQEQYVSRILSDIVIG